MALTAKISLIGTQKALEDVKSPLPWVSDKGLEHGAFARWATDTGKCFMVPQDGETISKEDCATSFTGFVFKALAPVEEVKALPSKRIQSPPPAPPPASVPSGPRPHRMQPSYVPPPATATMAIVQGQQKFQIQLMYHPEYCLSADGESILMEKRDKSASQSFTLQRVSACDGHGTAYQLQVGGKCVKDDGTLKLSDCSHSPAWVKLLPVINEKDLVMNITLKLQDNPAASFGETYMGNPGVHLPWDVKHLIDYPWAQDHCATPKPLYSDPAQACYKQFRKGLEVQCPDQDKDAKLLGDGQQCSGLCRADGNPCSCGTMSCPGCRSGFGYSGMTDTSFLPDGCIFVGCTQGADPAKPTGTYYPFLIPGGLNIRTCPSNVLDGRSAWTKVAPRDEAPMCAVNDMCDGEQFIGTMRLSGWSFRFCCPGATSDPFSALSLGYYGLMPEKGHYGGHGGIGGARCNSTGCNYRPSCACPWSVPSFNIRVTGPSTSLGNVFIPHPTGKDLSKNFVDKIVVMPQLDEASHFDLYAVAIGSDDSFHAGNNVNLNPPGVAAFLKSCTLPCERRHECASIEMPYYPGFGGPQEVNPSGAWNVLEPSLPSLFDDRRIVIAPKLTRSKLHMGPVFIGHPGKTYVGDQPDLRGIFQGLENRPTDGPGSAPGGTTGVGTEWLKAFFQCKESIVSGTEFDPRIWY